MKATTQHETHPDAENLNAFAEQVLSERERSEMLRHLAVCGRCRQVIGLTREAAEAEAAAEVMSPAVRPVAQARRGWWKEWRLALAPVAALAATALVAIYVHQHNAERSAQMAQTTPRAVMQRDEPPVSPAMQPESPAAAPRLASPAAPAAEKKELKTENSSSEARQQSPEMAMLPEKPSEPAALDTSAAQLQAAPPPPAEAPTGREALKTKQQEDNTQIELQKQQSGAGAEPRRSFAAKANMPVSMAGAGGGASASSEQVEVTAAAPEPKMRTLHGAGFGSLGGLQANAVATRAIETIHLPSGKRAVSLAFAGPRMLAIDKAGALYLSEDSGNTWERVAQQWSGRALVVRREAQEKTGADKAPEAEGNLRAARGAGGAPAEAPIFEIVNDKGQIWKSTDGKTWTAE